MGVEEPKRAESEAPTVPSSSHEEDGPVKQVKDAADEEKNLQLVLASDQKAADPPANAKSSRDSHERDAVLARVETEKRYALIQAWEENEKAKVENKAHKKISAIGSWESTKKAYVEAKIKEYEETIERKKVEYAEKMKNKIAELRKEAEEKRATIDAKKGEECLKIEETAAKFRAAGYTPKKFLGCFSS